MIRAPHYLLFSEAGPGANQTNTWRFVLQHVESSKRLVVTEHEPDASGERLELLAVVRGLEALDGPARVTLVTKSRYVSRGLKYGLSEWRASDWNWERFGRVVPVKDRDLWQRVDRALLFHAVDCQAWQFVEPAPLGASQSPQSAQTAYEARHKRARRLVKRQQPRHRTIMAASGPRNPRTVPSFVERALRWTEMLKALASPAQQAVQGAA